MSKTQEAVTVIDRIASETIIVPIVGTAPLLVHRFSEKAKREMLDRTQGKKTPKQPKNPVAEFEAARYLLPQNGHQRFGFPSVGFKAATVSAARFYPKNDVTMTGLRQFMFFHGELGTDGISLVEILPVEPVKKVGRPKKSDQTEWPRMREDVARVGNGGSDLRYRPEFWPWRADLKITYVTSALTRGSVLSLIDAGGMGVGVGDWRPERRGDFGTYRVDTDREVEVVTGGKKK